jgi:O-antigen/teichoic acid export membrane protein
MSARQIRLNGLFTAFGFFLGAVNVLLLYTRVFSPEIYGIISFILASATLLFPLVSLGMQQTILRYYEGGDEFQQEQIVRLSLQLISLFSFLVIGVIMVFGTTIATGLSSDQKITTQAVYAITAMGILMAYFEVFFSIAKVHFKTTTGVFLKEVFPRLGILLILSSHFIIQPLKLEPFLILTCLLYFFRALLMGIMAYTLKPFRLLQIDKLSTYNQLFVYGGLVVLGSGLSLAFLEIDKVMLYALSSSSNVALYTVFIFMATTIAIPLRSIQPLYNAECAALQQRQKIDELSMLVQRAISISSYYGVVILGVVLTFQPLLRSFLPAEYHSGFFILPLLLLLKLIDSSFTPINSLFYYSKFYKTYLLFSLGFLIVMILLNLLLIPLYGIYGAAIATSLSVLLFGLVKVWASYSLLCIKTIRTNHLLPALSALAFIGVEFSVQVPWLDVVRFVLMGALVLVFWRMKVFSKSFLG